jgi:hypothetical protein
VRDLPAIPSTPMSAPMAAAAFLAVAAIATSTRKD